MTKLEQAPQPRPALVIDIGDTRIPFFDDANVSLLRMSMDSSKPNFLPEALLHLPPADLGRTQLITLETHRLDSYGPRLTKVVHSLFTDARNQQPGVRIIEIQRKMNPTPIFEQTNIALDPFQSTSLQMTLEKFTNNQNRRDPAQLANKWYALDYYLQHPQELGSLVLDVEKRPEEELLQTYQSLQHTRGYPKMIDALQMTGSTFSTLFSALPRDRKQELLHVCQGAIGAAALDRDLNQYLFRIRLLLDQSS